LRSFLPNQDQVTVLTPLLKQLIHLQVSSIRLRQVQMQ